MNQPFQICIFDDHDATYQTPYQLTRPVYTIPIGMDTLVHKIQRFFPKCPLTLLCRPDQEVFLRQRFDAAIAINECNKSLPVLYLNGRCAPSKQQIEALMSDVADNQNYLFVNQRHVIAIYCTNEWQDRAFEQLKQQPTFDEMMAVFRNEFTTNERKYVPFTQNWWDYLTLFPTIFAQDFDAFHGNSLIEGDVASFSTLLNDQSMAISATSCVHNYVVLDAKKGPIIIDDHACIQPFSHIEGPCYIGAHTTIESHSIIRSSFIGDHCKVGGEVVSSVIQAYSNKQHAGYIGHTIMGEWVNLGAGSTVSNLNASYSPVVASSGMTSTTMPSDQLFLGAAIGDFVKTSVHTVLYGGSVVGGGSTLLGSVPHAKCVPPFMWGEPGQYVPHRMASFLTTLERMMARRERWLTQDSVRSMKRIYAAIHSDRHD